MSTLAVGGCRSGKRGARELEHNSHLDAIVEQAWGSLCLQDAPPRAS